MLQAIQYGRSRTGIDGISMITDYQAKYYAYGLSHLGGEGVQRHLMIQDLHQERLKATEERLIHKLEGRTQNIKQKP
jgi:hypothetical protein